MKQVFDDLNGFVMLMSRRQQTGRQIDCFTPQLLCMRMWVIINIVLYTYMYIANFKSDTASGL